MNFILMRNVPAPLVESEYKSHMHIRANNFFSDFDCKDSQVDATSPIQWVEKYNKQQKKKY